jgi:Zn-dependent protease with chaperone function
VSVLTSGLTKTMTGDELRAVTIGHVLLDDYLEFVAARARPNTLLAVAYDLKVFFTEVAKWTFAVSRLVRRRRRACPVVRR